MIHAPNAPHALDDVSKRINAHPHVGLLDLDEVLLTLIVYELGVVRDEIGRIIPHPTTLEDLLEWPTNSKDLLCVDDDDDFVAYGCVWRWALAGTCSRLAAVVKEVPASPWSVPFKGSYLRYRRMIHAMRSPSLLSPALVLLFSGQLMSSDFIRLEDAYDMWFTAYKKGRSYQSYDQKWNRSCQCAHTEEAVFDSICDRQGGYDAKRTTLYAKLLLAVYSTENRGVYIRWRRRIRAIRKTPSGASRLLACMWEVCDVAQCRGVCPDIVRTILRDVQAAIRDVSQGSAESVAWGKEVSEGIDTDARMNGYLVEGK